MHKIEDVHRQFAECFPEGPVRAYAYLLSKRLEEGHVCIPADLSMQEGEEMPYDLSGVDELPRSNPWLSQPGEGRTTPFVSDGGRVYLQRYHAYETAIVRMLGEKLSVDESVLSERMRGIEGVSALVSEMNAGYPIEGLSAAERVDWQLVAALTALLHDFSIITGGPGTGKTTTLAKLLRILFALMPKAKVALAAPTGKAANRMSESLKSSCSAFPEEVSTSITSLKPSTLHRLLGIGRQSNAPKFHADNPLPFDFIVVDEASMIDMPMFARLLSASGRNGRVVLLGDKDQLASVEAGSLLGDLCQVVQRRCPLNSFSTQRKDWLNAFIADPERKVPAAPVHDDPFPLQEGIVELAFSHRVKEAPRIRELSRAVLMNDVKSLEGMMNAEPHDEIVFDHGYDPARLQDFVNGYESFIAERDPLEALRKLNAIRVLVTVREGPRGLHAMNRRIEEMLAGKRWIRTGRLFYENRPVIVTRNNRETGLFNGDVGIVRKIGNTLRVCFETDDKGLRDLPAAYLSNCETVYAMTIHKSQGSEFNRVMVILPEGTDNPLLTRELLYTGITRARRQVVITGSKETLLHACGRNVSRTSGLSDRLS
jgi:exodeoxyribonuclease V alpha subunit